MSAPMERVAGAAPEVAFRVSQDCVLVAVQPRDPPPAFAIETLCAAGLVPPLVAENAAAWVDSESTGGAPVSVKVTEIVCGELVASEAATVMVSVYVPAARPAVVTLIDSGVGALPETADR